MLTSLEQLVEDYQRKVNTISTLLALSPEKLAKYRLKIKLGCYRTFLSELNKALEEKKLFESQTGGGQQKDESHGS